MKNKQLTENFWLNEFLKSATAIRQGGEMLLQQMNPSAEVMRAIHYHVKKTVQPARTFFGVGISITSGLRAFLLNAFVKGSESSQHCEGEASDQQLSNSVFEKSPEIISLLNSLILAITDKQPRDDLSANFYLFAYYAIFRHECDIDQLIHEYGEDGQPDWVHASSSKESDRRQILIKRSGEGYIELTLKEALLLGC